MIHRKRASSAPASPNSSPSTAWSRAAMREVLADRVLDGMVGFAHRREVGFRLDDEVAGAEAADRDRVGDVGQLEREGQVPVDVHRRAAYGVVVAVPGLGRACGVASTPVRPAPRPWKARVATRYSVRLVPTTGLAPPSSTRSRGAPRRPRTPASPPGSRPSCAGTTRTSTRSTCANGRSSSSPPRPARTGNSPPDAAGHARRARVHAHARADDGWDSTHTIVEIVNDDMPFLVDTVTMHVEPARARDPSRRPPDRARRTRDADGAAARPRRCAGDHGERVVARVVHARRGRPRDRPRGARPRPVTRSSPRSHDLRAATVDWLPMLGALRHVIDDLDANGRRRSTPTSWPKAARSSSGWPTSTSRSSATARYELVADDGDDALAPVAGHGARRPAPRAGDRSRLSFADAAARGAAPGAREAPARSSRRRTRCSTVHRPAYLDYVGVKKFDDAGEVVGEHRFLGLWTSSAYNASPIDVPVVRRKVQAVIDRAGFAAAEPRPEGPHRDPGELPARRPLPDRRRCRSTTSRWGSCACRNAAACGCSCTANRTAGSCRASCSCRATATRRRCGCGSPACSSTRTRPPGTSGTRACRSRCSPGCTSCCTPTRRGPPHGRRRGARSAHRAPRPGSWADDLREALLATHGEEAGLAPLPRVRDGVPRRLPGGLRRARSARRHLATRTRRAQPTGSRCGSARRTGGRLDFKLYGTGDQPSLSEVLPAAAQHGRHRRRRAPLRRSPPTAPRRVWVKYFRLRFREPDRLRRRLRATLVRGGVPRGRERRRRGRRLQPSRARGRARVARGRGAARVREVPAAGRHALQPGLHRGHARRAPADRACAHRVVRRPPRPVVRRAGRRQRRAPWRGDPRRARRGHEPRRGPHPAQPLHARAATLRTNWFQSGPAGASRPCIALKFDPAQVPDLPLPRPMFEIFVYSPRVEGVHLRASKVARGGMRWSDRREDFRTEVLDLMKAQRVKNAVIVPGGAKGGFVVKRPPVGDRDALQAEVVACYRMFIGALLDVTDNLVDGIVVPPPQVVRYDGDDPYLVVAADKGTATFSDIANEIAVSRGFWLGDAFASGGSAGYDHKRMGITARGAWESVKRHFRDVDHRPRPPTTSRSSASATCRATCSATRCCCRRTSGSSPRSTTVTCSSTPIPTPPPRSRNGSACSRCPARRGTTTTAHSRRPAAASTRVRRSRSRSRPQVRERLGLDPSAVSLTPMDLVRAILRAPVDLLFNGGIGTYVKARDETQRRGRRQGERRAARQRRRPALPGRRRGRQPRVHATRPHRIRAARRPDQHRRDRQQRRRRHVRPRGEHQDPARRRRAQRRAHGRRPQRAARDDDRRGRRAGAARQLPPEPRPRERTGAVGAHGRRAHPVRPRPRTRRPARPVRRATPRRRGARRAPPLRRRAHRRRNSRYCSRTPRSSSKPSSCTAPCPTTPTSLPRSIGYFPEPLPEQYAAEIERHPLRREIIATVLVNSMVNRAGTTFAFRLAQETGAIRSGHRARPRGRLARVRPGPPSGRRSKPSTRRSPATPRPRCTSRAASWSSGRAAGSSATGAGRSRSRRRSTSSATASARVAAVLPDLLLGGEREWIERETALARVPRRAERRSRERVAGLESLYTALDITDLAEQSGHDVEHVAAVYATVGDHLQLDWLRDRMGELPRVDRWQSLSRLALREDVYAEHRAVTAAVLAGTDPGFDAETAFKVWADFNRPGSRPRPRDLRRHPQPRRLRHRDPVGRTARAARPRTRVPEVGRWPPRMRRPAPACSSTRSAIPRRGATRRGTRTLW